MKPTPAEGIATLTVAREGGYKTEVRRS